TVAMTGDAALIPPAEDYVRMPTVKGGYVFRPKPGGAVEIDYQLHVEPGGALPAWLVNALAVDTPFETLKGMREAAKKPKYRDAEVPGVREPDP
ncbi:MAG: hypothetical protein K8I02_00875, partial [Candidatus Methylomirabilis sp.]|nr:hypothetical protein [Deltaproteobacteria bacterium]